MCGGQRRTICEGQFSPSTVWVLGESNSRHQACWQVPLPTGAPCWPSTSAPVSIGSSLSASLVGLWLNRQLKALCVSCAYSPWPRNPRSGKNNSTEVLRGRCFPSDYGEEFSWLFLFLFNPFAWPSSHFFSVSRPLSLTVLSPSYVYFHRTIAEGPRGNSLQFLAWKNPWCFFRSTLLFLTRTSALYVYIWTCVYMKNKKCSDKPHVCKKVAWAVTGNYSDLLPLILNSPCPQQVLNRSRPGGWGLGGCGWRQG